MRWPGPDQGATMVEYSIMVFLVALAAIGLVRLLGLDVAALFQSVADGF